MRVGDEVVVLPSERRTRVAAIDTFEGELPAQSAPFSVTLRLADEVDISRGDVHRPRGRAAPGAAAGSTRCWCGSASSPWMARRRYLVKHSTRTVPARLEQILWRKDLENLTEVPAETLALNDIGKVRLVAKRPLLCDPYRDNRSTGAFIVIDALTHDTVAAGMILGPASDGDKAARTLISAQERRERLGQRGEVVLLPDFPEAEERAYQLERRLFDQGRHVSVVRGDTEVALALAEAGLIVLLHTVAPQARRALRDQLRDAGLDGGELEASADLDGWVRQVLPAQESKS